MDIEDYKFDAEEYNQQHVLWQLDDIQVRKEMSRISGDKAIWHKHFCSILPRCINGRWYWREWIWYTEALVPGGIIRRYGDDFDRLKDDR